MPKLKIWVITNDPYDPKFLSPLQSKALFTFEFITNANTFSPDGPLSSTGIFLGYYNMKTKESFNIISS